MSAQLFLDLARQNNLNSRHRLLEQVLFSILSLDHDAGGKELKLICEIFEIIFPKLEIYHRKTIAEKLQSISNVPQSILFIIVRDDIEVAEFTIRNCNYIQTEILCHVARDLTPKHRIAITERSWLPAQLSSALIGFGNIEVHARVAVHSNVEFPQVVQSMLPGPDRGTGRNIRTEVAGSALRMAEEVVKRLRRSYSNLETELARLNLSGSPQVAGAIFSELVEVNHEIAISTVERGDPEAVMIFIKVAGGSFEALRQFLIAHSRSRNKPMPRMDEIRKTFEQMPRENAVRFVSFVNMLQSMRAAA